MATVGGLLFLVACAARFHATSSSADTGAAGDAAALRSLKEQLQNTPPNWGKSNDPCGGQWDGVTCNNNSRVTALKLSTMGLKGELGGDIGSLTELTSLDLSYNKELTGSLSPRFGDLQKLQVLILAGCSFSGNIPTELGKLSELTYLALNRNNFNGRIPPSLGSLSEVYWMDMGENQLTGTIPVSTSHSPGLDLLLKAKHFHFSKNKLSGIIPPKLFHSNMALLHILFDGNQLTGSIPSTVGLVHTLEVIRLDRNSLTGEVPSSLNNLANINELNLAHNGFTGPVPNLSGMKALAFVDLSNNSFDKSEAPNWFSTSQALITLVFEHGSLQGVVPETLFSFPQLQQVKLRNNEFNGTLNMGSSISQHLKLVDLENNQISLLTVGYEDKITLMLKANPVCANSLSSNSYCQVREHHVNPYSTSLGSCGSQPCPPGQKNRPQSCECAIPYQGIFYFQAFPSRELSNFSRFHLLENSLQNDLDLTPGSVSLQNLSFNSDDYLQVHTELFPSTGKTFSRSEIQTIGFYLSSLAYKLPLDEFGPYYFIASPYAFPETGGRSVSLGAIFGIAIGGILLVIVLIGVGIYAIFQKKRAERAIGLSKPFASWALSGEDSGGAPQLKGARVFSYDELRKCTNHFGECNEIGSGGFGKVYKGTLPNGQLVAIKRARQGSMQGGLEFKTEIELLSRVHHKNLVGLMGFCFESGEQMLVYEFIPKGTLRESLSGRSGIFLDWKRRLRIALGSARGLAYLHELANPPIIHRDVKSSNILLDEHLTAKVADFGLSKLVTNDASYVSTQVKGTVGYVDPEYYLSQQLTEKSDVYSFGVVMLELLTARLPIEMGKYVVQEVRMAMNEAEEYHGLTELIDPVLRSMATDGFAGFGSFLELAMRCVEDAAADRPTMSQVVKTFESILQNDGLNTNSTSTSSSATDFGIGAKGFLKHPCDDSWPKKCAPESDAFDYSGGFTHPVKVEPK